MKYKYRHTEMYKDVRIDCRANSKRDLMEKVYAKKRQIDRQSIDPDTRLRDFIFLYLRTYKKNVVSDSWYRDLEYLADKIVDGISNKPIGNIHPIEVQKFLNRCSHYSASTIKKIFDLTKQVFQHAAINGATAYTFDLKKPKGKQPKHVGRSLTDDEQTDLLHAVSGHRGELFIKIMYYCGLRPSEVAALVWDDVDLDQKILHVRRAVKKDGSIGQPKSASGVRDIPIPTSLSMMMEKAVTTKNSPVCGQRNGAHTKSSMRKLWNSVLSAVEKETGERPGYRMYDIRHTYCTNLERKGVPINIASRLMGHSDISITSRIYTHATDATLEIARKLIDE